VGDELYVQISFGGLPPLAFPKQQQRRQRAGTAPPAADWLANGQKDLVYLTNPVR
jgi:hypothetical protein